MYEIFDEIKQAVRQRWLFVLLAVLLAAAGAAFLADVPDPAYRTTAIIGVDPEAANANDRVDFIQNMAVAAHSPSVIDAVAGEVGLDPTFLADRLSVARIADSNLTQVRFDDNISDPSRAELVVTRIPEEAANLIGDSQMAELSNRLDAAERLLLERNIEWLEASDAVDVAVAANGNIAPDVQLRTLQDAISDLRIQLLSVDPDDSTTATQIRDSITELQALLPEAADAAREFDELVREQDTAATLARDAQQKVAEADFELRTMGAGPAVAIQQSAVPIRSLQPLIRAVVVAMIISFVLAATAVAVMLRRRSNRVGMPEMGTSVLHADQADLSPVPDRGILPGNTVSRRSGDRGNTT